MRDKKRCYLNLMVISTTFNINLRNKKDKDNEI